MLHDDNRTWAVTLQQMPQWTWRVMMTEPYAGDDLETLRCTLLRELARYYPDGWRPNWFEVRRPPMPD